MRVVVGTEQRLRRSNSHLWCPPQQIAADAHSGHAQPQFWIPNCLRRMASGRIRRRGSARLSRHPHTLHLYLAWSKSAPDPQSGGIAWMGFGWGARGAAEVWGMGWSTKNPVGMAQSMADLFWAASLIIRSTARLKEETS
eukprot:CAMPEP_0115102098 /NCGR_PEP_ID=MMETSP0227-20121206/33670_1 /TAXON_ID=89957 /ORGANISM="Polarella glacialis, Strain CCMP 1383" /LENGTH=139 /DNA_ID=CAMNT_0002498065 /DNA_START=106 /DNA_END=526 /DNA_ORIENTATION=-